MLQVMLAFLLSLSMGSIPVMRVVKATRPGVSLLHNGGFEEMRGGEVVAWAAWQHGFRAAAGEGQNGSRAAVCEILNGEGEFGASQTLALDRIAVAPIVVRAWSKARNVSGSTDAGYSIYVDLLYTDGTPLWGQTGDFGCGTHGWEQREVVIIPQKPVRSLTVYCLFRGHTGKVWFDDVSVTEVRAAGGAVLFQGAQVRVVRPPPPLTGQARTMATRDGLQWAMRGNTVTSLKLDGRELAARSPSGFLARDVAANSDVYAFESGHCPRLGLKIEANFTASPDHVAVSGRLSDVTGKDRAVTLVFALPLDATGWRWGDDIRRSRVIQGTGEYENVSVVRCGATGTMSLYPLAALSSDRAGIAIALDMAHPAQYRLVYHAGTKQLMIAYDFGLVKETARFPGGADFRFVVYRFDPRWGFRAAFRKLAAIFPEQFVVRSKKQGLWMPFTDVSTVQDWQDFGFRYHEGDNNVAFDDAHGILSFRYTEPMTWWMPMKKEVPRTEAEALRARDEWARSDNEFHRRMAQVSRVAAMAGPDGRPALSYRNEPWCDGAVWSLNPNPHLPGTPNAATIYWNDAIKQKWYGLQVQAQPAGEYLDSLEGYATGDLNFRREHFRSTTVPLTFASDTKQPALFKGLAVFEFTRWISDDVHRMGKLMFANSVPYRCSFLCPLLDVMGTETNWLSRGQYQPAGDAQMSLWRTMSYQKPYLLLMNTDFDVFTPDRVEKYFQRSLFYGMFPGMFSHNVADRPYWQNPSWYNRDRPLFQKYVPLIRRIAEAGWQPVTEARCNNPQIFIERFGPDAHRAIYFTLMNESEQPQRGVVMVSQAPLKMSGPLAVHELLSGETIPVSGARFSVALPPQTTWAVELR